MATPDDAQWLLWTVLRVKTFGSCWEHEILGIGLDNLALVCKPCTHFLCYLSDP